MLSDLIQPAAQQMVGYLDAEIKAALDAVSPGWTLIDVKARCRIERVAGLPFETLYLDSTPLLEIHPVECELERLDDRVVARYTRKIRRLPTGDER